MKILIFLILTSSFIPQFAISSTLESRMYENHVKRWEISIKIKNLIDEQNLHHSFSEDDELFKDCKSDIFSQVEVCLFSEDGEALFKDCKSDVFSQVKVCLNVTHIKIKCYVGYNSFDSCKIAIEYFLSKPIPRLNTIDGLYFDGYVKLDYISNGVKRRKTVKVDNQLAMIGPNQFEKSRGFTEFLVYFDSTSVQVADISFNIKSISTIDKPTQFLGSSN